MFVWAPQFNPYDQAAAPLPTISQPHPLSAGLGQPPISQQHREDHTGMNAPSSASSLHHHSESTHQDAPQQSHSQERSAQVSQEELFKALGSQKVFIDGDPDNSETIDLFYYRMAGSTAIHPGINRINLRLHKAHTTSPYSQSAVTPVDDKEILKGGNAASQPMIPSPHQDLQPHMFDDSGMPLPAIYEPLLDLFFKRASAFFPSVSQKRMAQRLETGTMSAFMLNVSKPPCV